MRPPCRIILDTSVLMLVYEGIDVIELIEDAMERKCEYYVPDKVLEELKHLAETSRGRRGAAARLALKYVQGRASPLNLGIDAPTADEAIKEFAASNPQEWIVATADHGMRRALKKAGVRVITWWPGKHRFVGVEPDIITQG